MKLFSYSSCSTCRKAIKWLRNNNISFELIDLISEPPSKKILILASKLYGDRKRLLNTSGASYRSIGKDAIKEMSDEAFYDNLLKDPKLIKRPFLFVQDENILVGFNEEKWSEQLL